MEENIPESLTVFAVAEMHRRWMRKTNMLGRLHEEINRRTRVARLFTNEASLSRLVNAIKINEGWLAYKRYLTMEMENKNGSSDSSKKNEERILHDQYPKITIRNAYFVMLQSELDIS